VVFFKEGRWLERIIVWVSAWRSSSSDLRHAYLVIARPVGNATTTSRRSDTGPKPLIGKCEGQHCE